MDIMGGFLFDAVTIIWNNVKVQTMLFMFHSYHFGFHMHNYIYKRFLLNTGLMREDPNDSTWCNICTMTDTYALRNHYKFQNFEDEAHKMFEEENKILGSNTVDLNPINCGCINYLIRKHWCTVNSIMGFGMRMQN